MTTYEALATAASFLLVIIGIITVVLMAFQAGQKRK
jgi:hypothetical protein